MVHKPKKRSFSNVYESSILFLSVPGTNTQKCSVQNFLIKHQSTDSAGQRLWTLPKQGDPDWQMVNGELLVFGLGRESKGLEHRWECPGPVPSTICSLSTVPGVEPVYHWKKYSHLKNMGSSESFPPPTHSKKRANKGTGGLKCNCLT